MIKKPKSKHNVLTISKKVSLNINVLIRILKMSMVKAFLAFSGNVFHSLGATKNARSLRNV